MELQVKLFLETVFLDNRLFYSVLIRYKTISKE